MQTLLNELANSKAAHLFSTSVTTFTTIYCTLNWWHYRSLANAQEKRDDDESDPKEKKSDEG